MMADVPADLLEAAATTCAKCWKAAHPPPPASALYLMDDYRYELSRIYRIEDDVMRLASGHGYDGTCNDLQYAAHREAYVRSGEDADLAKMLQHVTLDEQ